MAIAYLSNSFPEPLEPYVWQEISELSRRHQRVLPCSVRRPERPADLEMTWRTLYLFPMSVKPFLQACWVFAVNFSTFSEFLLRAITGRESIGRRIRNLLHTW